MNIIPMTPEDFPYSTTSSPPFHPIGPNTILSTNQSCSWLYYLLRLPLRATIELPKKVLHIRWAACLLSAYPFGW
jgi:hypothetical protein